MQTGLALADALGGDAKGAGEALAASDGIEPIGVLLGAERLRATAWTMAAAGSGPSGAAVLMTEAAEMAGLGLSTVAAYLLHDAVRLGGGPEAGDRLAAVAERVDGPYAAAIAEQGAAVRDRDADGVVRAACDLAGVGAKLAAAEAALVAAGWYARANASRRAGEARRLGRAWQAECEGAVTPGLAGAGTALTARQAEIARLAAEGLASRAIADRLGVSVRTVDNQLQRAYDRLGVDNRAALAHVLGLTPS
jgi:DNA-binding CsgD family transcriptional regulator